MSYWVSLRDKDENVVEVESHSEGGTYAMGGVPEADLNVTYNYSAVYSLLEFNLRDLQGKSGLETADWLAGMVFKLGTHRDDDYWKPTPGNAGHALNILAGWAKQHPEATWNVS